MNLDEALQTLFAEAGELLEQMETALLRFEQPAEDADTLNAIFRAVQTIKGLAGLFGFDHIVAFSQLAESVADKVHKGLIRFSSELVALFLSVGKHLAQLIAAINSKAEPDDELVPAGDELMFRLGSYCTLAVTARQFAMCFNASSPPGNSAIRVDSFPLVNRKQS